MENYKCSCGKICETAEEYHEHLKKEIAEINKEEDTYEYYNKVGQ